MSVPIVRCCLCCFGLLLIAPYHTMDYDLEAVIQHLTNCSMDAEAALREGQQCRKPRHVATPRIHSQTPTPRTVSDEHTQTSEHACPSGKQIHCRWTACFCSRTTRKQYIPRKPGRLSKTQCRCRKTQRELERVSDSGGSRVVYHPKMQRLPS